MPDAGLMPEPLDRLDMAADAMDTLAGLLGQATDIDACGRDGLAVLLTLLAREVEEATRALHAR
jgi:hypothetical protein